MLKFSVIIPTFNRREALAQSLATLFAQDFAAHAYEIVVAVDGSTDGTVEFLRGLKPPCSLRIVEHSRNRGQAAARNSALAVAQGEIALMIDDDMLCDAALLKAHASAHRNAGAQVVIGPVLLAPESASTLATDFIRAEAERWYRARPCGAIPWNEAVGANTSVDCSVLRKVGGYDENLFRMSEDVDLALRLWQAGAQFCYRPDAMTHQIYRKSVRRLIDDESWGGRNRVFLCRKAPACRPYCGLSALTHGSWWKRSVRAICARSPVSPDFLLSAPYWTAQRLRSMSPARNFGLRLLELRISLAQSRAAIRAAGSWDLMRREFGMRLPVLLYHHVGPRRTRTHPELTISPGNFERHVHWLARRGYTGITPTDWLQWRVKAKPLPSKPVLISFDDGYADLAEYALPTLRRYGLSAVVYIITGRIGGEVAWKEPASTEAYRLMSAEQIRHWAREGIEFGAHSRTHADLTSLSGRRLREEVAGSKEDLERLTGVPPVSFAYPFGYVNETAIEAAKSSFDLAMSCMEGLNDLATDPCLLRRTMVRPTDSVADIECRATLGWSPLERIRTLLRVRSRLKATLNAARRLTQTTGPQY